MARRPRCVFLTGPSSAGKTSLALAFQRIADEPWFFLEGDRLSGGFPSDRPEFVTLEWDRRVREACARADRFAGTARRQAEQLEGIPFDYDLVTDASTPEELAADLAGWLASDPVPRALGELAPERAAPAVSARAPEPGDGVAPRRAGLRRP